MNNTDIMYKSVCKLDSTGRIVIPATLRRLLGLAANDRLTVTLTEDGMFLKSINNLQEIE